MKKNSLHKNTFLLLFSLAFITSCNGQSTQNVSLDSASQIDDYVVEVFEDNKGSLWFGTISKGAARYGTSLNDKVGQASMEDGAGQTGVRISVGQVRLIKDPDSNRDAQEKSLTYLSTKDGLCNNTVVSIAQDKEGNMWFGTHAGASKYNPHLADSVGHENAFTNFTETKGLHGAGCKILIDNKGNIWAGTNHGAFRFNGSSFSEFKIPVPVIENPSHKWEAGKVWSLMEDKKGNIWFARDGYGACKYDPQDKSFTHFTTKDGLWSNNVASIAEDNHGNIWFGCLTSDFPEYIKVGGVCRYDGKIFTKYSNIEGLSENDIYTIYNDSKGNIWIGATGVGAYRFDGKNFTLFKETDRKDLTVNFGVQSILEDKKGNLWFGFSGGLFLFNSKSFINVTQDGPWK